jgi:hypothetical protein
MTTALLQELFNAARLYIKFPNNVYSAELLVTKLLFTRPPRHSFTQAFFDIDTDVHTIDIET